MGLLAGLLTGVTNTVKRIKTTLTNAKIGSAAIQAGFTIKGGADTDAAKAQQSFWKTVPVYVWGIAIFIIGGLAYLLFRRKR